MTSTTAPALTLIPGESVEVLGLDADHTLGMVINERRRQDEAAARELKAVTHWADLHRVTDGTIGAIDASLCAGYARPGVDPLLGREGQLRFLGEGAFAVEEFAVSQLATALGMGEAAARAYVGQGLELRERLPRLWGKVMAGLLPAWKARQIAAETIPLNAAAAGYVDAHLAPFAHTMSLHRILRCVHAAVIRHDHTLAADRAAKAAEGRGVWVDDDLDGTSRIVAVTTTPDAAAFEAAVHQVAGDLHTLGSTAPEQVRRATAIGVLADPQHALDLHTTAQAGAEATPLVEGRAKRASRNQFHIHLHTDTVTSASGVARVEGYGPRALETIQRWLTGLGADATVKLTPVVDLTDHISVDAYEVPDRLRTQTEHRDHSCRFPWCGRRGSFDVDHIDPYVARDDGGPPGQTNSSNLARLCRFHHRVKTHGDWDYHRDRDGTLTWTSPLGRTYTVDEHGTRPRG
jgi:hypothetical protein